MKRYRAIAVALACAAGAVVVPEAAVAQQSGGWWEWALGEVVRSGGSPVTIDGRKERPKERGQDGGVFNDGVFDRVERGDRDDRRDRRGEARGPKFCHNGEGHPVHGRRWCKEKGFGTGGVAWEQRGWEDIILRDPRGTDRKQGVVDQGGLLDILGDIVFSRVDGESRRIGGDGLLTGRWLRPAGAATVLQIRSGGLPVAELTDLDGDGRIDAVLVPRR